MRLIFSDLLLIIAFKYCQYFQVINFFLSSSSLWWIHAIFSLGVLNENNEKCNVHTERKECTTIEVQKMIMTDIEIRGLMWTEQAKNNVYCTISVWHRKRVFHFMLLPFIYCHLISTIISSAFTIHTIYRYIVMAAERVIHRRLKVYTYTHTLSAIIVSLCTLSIGENE